MAAHHFEVDIAIDYGVETAIIVANMDFWLSKNKSNNTHFYDGKYWTYNSIRAFSLLFPYYTEAQIRKYIDKMVEVGILIKGNYNENKYDQTRWYTFADDFVEKYKSILFFSKIDLPNLTNGSIEKDKCYIDTDNKLTDNKLIYKKNKQKKAIENEKYEVKDKSEHKSNNLEIKNDFFYVEKEKEKKSCGKKKEKENRDFVDPKLMDSWMKFVDMRKKTRRPFRGIESEKALYDKMIKDSEGNIKSCINALETSTASGYQGVFPKKQFIHKENPEKQEKTLKATYIPYEKIEGELTEEEMCPF